MEIASLRNSEQLLLNIAYSYTTQYDHREVPSGAGDLYAASHIGNLRDVIDSYRSPSDSAPAVTTEEQTATVPPTTVAPTVTDEPAVTALDSTYETTAPVTAEAPQTDDTPTVPVESEVPTTESGLESPNSNTGAGTMLLWIVVGNVGLAALLFLILLSQRSRKTFRSRH
jgi:hypothetical protein